MQDGPERESLHRFDTVDSTNERALAAIASGEGRHGDAFVALEQSAGRGTRGRRWSSGRGGLYLSLILESEEPPAPGRWTIAGALAVLDLCDRAGVRAALDWPNDVVTAGARAKLAGVLAEARTSSRAARHAYALGVGVNVFGAAIAPEVAAERAVASLAGEGAALTLDDAEAILLERLRARAAEEPAALFPAFFARCLQAGAEVEVSRGTERLVGTFAALEPLRGVRLDARADGAPTWIPLGHVAALEFARPPAP